MKIEMLSVDFTDEQKRYLEGFTTGLQISRVGQGFGGNAGKANAEAVGPEAAHIKAQDKVTASGKKLADQEKFKRDEHPFDAYPRLKQQALDNAPPNPADNFRWRYYGLFYVAPALDSYMCRLRIPNGIIKHWQFAGLADLAEQLCGPFCHVTTRANLQVREIPPKHAVALIEGIQDLGLCSRGTGADNIRNVTGTPTAGIDPQELLDTREYAREWHYHILNDRSLYGLPRKFNVAFDGAGKIAVLEDTNDIAFSAVEVKDGFGVEPGVWFRLGIGGITGHRDFAKYGDIIVKPADATKVSDAIVRIFIDLGDRTNRNKARLKYVLDGMGHEKFLALVEERLGRAFARVPPEAMAPRPEFDRMAHIGVHRQKQEGLNWIGVSLPLGKVTCEQMRGLAKIAQDLGDGDIRLTVWQNLLIPGVRDENVELAIAAIGKIGLSVEASQIRAGLIACTGNAGCRFAASNTKLHAAEIGDWCEPRVNIDTPLNIHVTGCHHSCAQHYISDIGLIAAKVPTGEGDDDDPVEGYHLFAGGGFGANADVGQEVFHDLKAEDAPRTVEKLLKAYLSHRASPEETFLSFARRHDGETLRKLAEAEVSS
jgi:ferredoxin-nitrite reductase